MPPPSFSQRSRLLCSATGAISGTTNAPVPAPPDAVSADLLNTSKRTTPPHAAYRAMSCPPPRCLHCQGPHAADAPKGLLGPRSNGRCLTQGSNEPNEYFERSRKAPKMQRSAKLGARAGHAHSRVWGQVTRRWRSHPLNPPRQNQGDRWF